MGIFDFLNRKKKSSTDSDSLSINEATHLQVSHLRQTSYPVKILVAWGEAIDGNQGIRDWLIKNGYPELGMFCFALKNEESAQQWLMKQGYPQFVALINGIEGDKKAREWLLKYDFKMLWHIALAADGNVDSKRFLLMTDKVYAGLAKKMERVKDQIEWNNNDIHSINP